MADGPTGERGRPNEDWISTVPGWPQLAGDPTEYVTELEWPLSVATYSEMRNDAQLSALYTASTWPIRRYHWMIDPRGAHPELVEALADDLGLDILGGPEATNRVRRFNWTDHLRLILQALQFGHYPFEVIGEIEDGLWRLRKLGPRPPHSVQAWDVAKDGGLNAIYQDFGDKQVRLGIERLLVYVWDQEPGSWVGRSIFRPLYRNWLIKDRLLRVDAVNNERAGVGVPTIEAPEGASQAMMDALQEMAQDYRGGEMGGGALPHGSRLRLQGIEGSQPRTLDSIRYHDEAMARAFLLMFMQLGQTQSGSRALGETFVDWYSLAQETIADWVCSYVTLYLISDWFEYNVGAGTSLPALTYEKSAQPEMSVSDLVSMTDSGLIVADPNLRTWLRTEHHLPESADPDAGPVEPPLPVPVPVAPVAEPS
jgi:hypothetical protein